jgi:hypothetical protein
MLRRMLARIPTRWRGAIMLTAFTLFSPFWIVSIVWEAVLTDGVSARPENGAELASS